MSFPIDESWLFFFTWKLYTPSCWTAWYERRHTTAKQQQRKCMLWLRESLAHRLPLSLASERELINEMKFSTIFFFAVCRHVVMARFEQLFFLLRIFRWRSCTHKLLGSPIIPIKLKQPPPPPTPASHLGKLLDKQQRQLHSNWHTKGKIEIVSNLLILSPTSIYVHRKARRKFVFNFFSSSSFQIALGWMWRDLIENYRETNWSFGEWIGAPASSSMSVASEWMDESNKANEHTKSGSIQFCVFIFLLQMLSLSTHSRWATWINIFLSDWLYLLSRYKREKRYDSFWLYGKSYNYLSLSISRSLLEK